MDSKAVEVCVEACKYCVLFAILDEVGRCGG